MISFEMGKTLAMIGWCLFAAFGIFVWTAADCIDQDEHNRYDYTPPRDCGTEPYDPERGI